MFLTAAAVLLSDRSSLVLGLVAVSFLLTVKSLPRVEWLYGTVAALLAALLFPVAWPTAPRLELMGCGTLAAFVLAGLAILVQRFKPALCARLGAETAAVRVSALSLVDRGGARRAGLTGRPEYGARDRRGEPRLVPAVAGGTEPDHAQSLSTAGLRARESGVSDLDAWRPRSSRR